MHYLFGKICPSDLSIAKSQARRRCGLRTQTRTFDDLLGLIWAVYISGDVVGETYAGFQFAGEDVDFVKELYIWY
jgi:hypothetical protein